MKTKSKGVKLRKELYEGLSKIAGIRGSDIKSVLDAAVEDFLLRVEKDGVIDIKMKFGSPKQPYTQSDRETEINEEVNRQARPTSAPPIMRVAGHKANYGAGTSRTKELAKR